MSYLLDKPLLFTPEGEYELTLEVALMERCIEEIEAELKDAPEYALSALRRELEAVDTQLSRLRDTLARGCRVANTGFVVAVGSEVTLADDEGEHTFTIAGPIAASPKHSCISYDSPLGQALLGAELGDYVEGPLGGGHHSFRVVGIRRGTPGVSAGLPAARRVSVAAG